MTRKRSEPKRRNKGGGGVMMGMRSTVQKVGKGVAGDDDAPAKKKSQWRGMNLFWNVLTGAAAIVAAAILLRRCGIVSF